MPPRDEYDERPRGVRERDIVVPPGQFAYVLDNNKGHVSVIVGPNSKTLQPNELTVVFDEESRSFKECRIEDARMEFVFASEGDYVRLQNPAKGGGVLVHPKPGAAQGEYDLDFGRLLNIHGPTSFPLWPGQISQVIPGHHLRSNQYLVVRVYNDKTARENLAEAVMKPQVSGDDEDRETPAENSVRQLIKAEEIVTGKLFIIKGMEVSFYIPPTGIEVVQDETGSFVRDAVTLERLEYCILLDEDGGKRYLKGPDVVFPNPTETFVADNDGNTRFRAIELNQISGIYIKVIADYEENGKAHKAGDELFITGNEQAIYYPREEHAIVRYGGRKEKHYAVAVPEGEGRYVLDRLQGKVDLVVGPTMLLPDPRTHVIVRRVLNQKEVSLWFPGNREAADYNARLAEILEATAGGAEFVTERGFETHMMATRGAESFAAPRREPRRKASENFAGDSMNRGDSFTPPRSVTLDTKYDGAVLIDVWPGYAVMVVSKTGDRRVVIGPEPILLRYDEHLMVLQFSTGTPKSDEKLEKSVYLQVHDNRVSDIVTGETKDLSGIPVRVEVAYRVKFDEEYSDRWFSVENYVELLTEHLRSRIRNLMKQHGIEEFYANYIQLIRNEILGAKDPETGERSGCFFEENGMIVYDVEVFKIKLDDQGIAGLIQTTQRQEVERALDLEAKRKELAQVIEIEGITRKTAKARTETEKHKLELEGERIEARKKAEMAQVAADGEIIESRQFQQRASNERLQAISAIELATEKARAEQEQELERSSQAITLEFVRAKSEAKINELQAIQPDLIASIRMMAQTPIAALMAMNLPKTPNEYGFGRDLGTIKAIRDIFGDSVAGEAIEGVLTAVQRNGENPGDIEDIEEE